MNPEELKDIIQELRDSNPYPNDIFLEPTKEQWKKLHEVCENTTGKVLDGFNGSLSRYVWNLCIDKLEILLGYRKGFRDG